MGFFKHLKKIHNIFEIFILQFCAYIPFRSFDIYKFQDCADDSLIAYVLCMRDIITAHF